MVDYNNVLQADDNDNYNVNNKHPFNLTTPVGNDFCNMDILLEMYNNINYLTFIYFICFFTSIFAKFLVSIGSYLV